MKKYLKWYDQYRFTNSQKEAKEKAKLEQQKCSVNEIINLKGVDESRSIDLLLHQLIVIHQLFEAGFPFHWCQSALATTSNDIEVGLN